MMQRLVLCTAISTIVMQFGKAEMQKTLNILDFGAKADDDSVSAA